MKTSNAAVVMMMTMTVMCASADAGEPPRPTRYTLAATPAELASRARAVDAVVGSFFLLARPFARSTIEKKTRPAEWVELSRGGEEPVVVSITFEGRPSVVSTLGKSAKWVSPEGDDYVVEVKEEAGGDLVQTLKGKDGSRTNRFQLGPEGKLTLSVEVTSSRFEGPLRYVLTYTQPGAAAHEVH